MASCVDELLHSSNASSLGKSIDFFVVDVTIMKKIEEGSVRELGGEGGENRKRLMEGKLNFSCVLCLCAVAVSYTPRVEEKVDFLLTFEQLIRFYCLSFHLL